MRNIRWWPLIGRAWRQAECITCYLIPPGRWFDRLHAWHMARLDNTDLPGPANQDSRDSAQGGSARRVGEFQPIEDDEWVAELHSINQLGKMGDLTRPIAQQTYYEVEAIIRQLRIPDWLPDRVAA